MAARDVELILFFFSFPFGNAEEANGIFVFNIIAAAIADLCVLFDDGRYRHFLFEAVMTIRHANVCVNIHWEVHGDVLKLSEPSKQSLHQPVYS